MIVGSHKGNPITWLKQKLVYQDKVLLTGEKIYFTNEGWVVGKHILDKELAVKDNTKYLVLSHNDLVYSLVSKEVRKEVKRYHEHRQLDLVRWIDGKIFGCNRKIFWINNDKLDLQNIIWFTVYHDIIYAIRQDYQPARDLIPGYFVRYLERYDMAGKRLTQCRTESFPAEYRMIIREPYLYLFYNKAYIWPEDYGIIVQRYHLTTLDSTLKIKKVIDEEGDERSEEREERSEEREERGDERSEEREERSEEREEGGDEPWSKFSFFMQDSQVYLYCGDELLFTE